MAHGKRLKASFMCAWKTRVNKGGAGRGEGRAGAGAGTGAGCQGNMSINVIARGACIDN